MNEECILPVTRSFDWFLSELHKTSHPDHEVIRIARTLQKYVHCNRDIFYTIENINEKTIRIKPVSDLADDTLISLSIFRAHIDWLHDHHAAPTARWYFGVCSSSFCKLGYFQIAQDLKFWMRYIRELVV